MGVWTPLFLPMALVAEYQRWRSPRMPLVPSDAPTEHEWVTVEICMSCGDETDHEYIQYADEPVVTRRCTDCEHIVDYWDAV